MKRLSVVLVSLLLGVSRAGAVGADGYMCQLAGAKALGMGNTFAAVADDPTAAYFNPAGLARQDSFALSWGMTPVSMQSEYTSDAGAGTPMADRTPVVPTFYASVPLSASWTAGLGINAPFGLETHWDHDGPFRYVTTDSLLRHISVNPVAAYKVSDRLSLGAGVVNANVLVQIDARVNQGPPTDGYRKIEADGGGWGWNLALLAEPRDGHTVGLSYRSEIKSHVSGDIRLSGLTGGAAALFGGSEYTTPVESDLWFPQTLLAGYAFERGPWTLALDLEWAGFSAVQETRVAYTQETDPGRLSQLNADNPITREWRDTWNLGLGFNRSLSDRTQVRGGLLYYASVIPEKNWDPSIPVHSRFGYFAGAGHTWGSLTVDLALGWIPFDQRRVHNAVGASSGSTVNGTYDTNLRIISLGVTWRTGWFTRPG